MGLIISLNMDDELHPPLEITALAPMAPVIQHDGQVQEVGTYGVDHQLEHG